MKKSSKQNINGIILLDKPQGATSNQVLQKVRWLFNAKKAGHTGSLDPLATGLLPICFGQSTKVCSYLLDSHKKYVTVIKLGETTDTLDSEGESLQRREVNVSDEQIQIALEQFRGAIKQVPPMYSALKKDGQPLYKLARKGEVIERPARDMFIHSLQAERIDELHVKLFVHCSSGFYIRSLAFDIGEVLGCGAHVVELRRTAIKDIDVSRTVSLDELIQLHDDNELSVDRLLDTDILLQDMPALDLTEFQVKLLFDAKPTRYQQTYVEGLHRLYDRNKRLFGIGEMLKNGYLKAHKKFIELD